MLNIKGVKPRISGMSSGTRTIWMQMCDENGAYIREFRTCVDMRENELSLCAFTTVAACE